MFTSDAVRVCERGLRKGKSMTDYHLHSTRNGRTNEWTKEIEEEIMDLEQIENKIISLEH